MKKSTKVLMFVSDWLVGSSLMFGGVYLIYNGVCVLSHRAS